MTIDPMRADRIAVMQIGHDITLLDERDLSRRTPCDGWTVADLIRHMNDEHEAFAAPVLGPGAERDDDPRHDFPLGAARWICAIAQAGPTIHVPKMDARLPVEQVCSVHFVDMLVHRWDLARSLGTMPPVAEDLALVALPIARSITRPGSPLVGTAYAPSVPQESDVDALDEIVALLGRDPRWKPPMAL